jgi:putative pyruvate formate lyase activating enzyme
MTLPSTEPKYLETIREGRFEEKCAAARHRLDACNLCPRRCGADRTAGETGVCKTGLRAVVSSFNPHFGEETPLVGRNGSGTLFFTHCSLMCLFCQNYDISHGGQGQEVSDEELAGIMLRLQAAGCHNINFVTPSHVVPQILVAVGIAAAGGLSVPLVYNSSGYDSVETLKLLDGVVDIYMPDFKFWDSEIAASACEAPDYPEVAREALIEMHRQVGDLVIDDGGLAVRGLLVRHLVLPGGLAGTRNVMRFLAQNLSAETYVNVMAQYRPCGRAGEIEELAVPVSDTEFQEALQMAESEGISRLDTPRRVFMGW